MQSRKTSSTDKSSEGLPEPVAVQSTVTPIKYGSLGRFLMSILTDSEQYARFVLMRFLRMVMSAVLWTIGVPLTIVSMVFIPDGVAQFILNWGNQGPYKLVGLLTGYPHVMLEWPLTTGLLCVTVGITCIALNISTQLPYRRDTRMPGIWTYACWRCGVEVRDTLLCSNCGAFRPANLVTWLLFALSLVITVAWYAWDAFWLVLTILVFWKR